MLDATDESILDALEEDGRATLAQLSRLSGLSVSAVQSRVQKLEKRGVIKGYRAVLDYELRGLPISAFVSVTPLDYSQEADIPGKLHELEGVVSCYSIAGAPSFIAGGSRVVTQQTGGTAEPHPSDGAGQHRKHGDPADVFLTDAIRRRR